MATSATLLLALLQARAADIKVIANSGVKADTISSAEIKRIFLLEGVTLDDGTRVQPVLNRNERTTETFLKEFLNTNNDALQTYYGTQVYTGKESMPRQLGSDVEMVAYVARTKGALGYVGTGAETAGVKVLTVVSAGSSAPRRLISRVEPLYPPPLKERNIGGTVRLQLVISHKGNVEDVQLLGGNPILAVAAMDAVKQWVYSPGNSKTTIEVSVPFDPRD